MRLRDWLIILTQVLASAISGTTDDHHLTTDPACRKYRAPRHRSRLDRASRGHGCTPCMFDRAFNWGSHEPEKGESR